MRSFLNRLANLLMKPLLASPLHFFASQYILLITVTGRKSGKFYTTPVEYREVEDTLMVFTQQERKWWRNLSGGAAVQVRIKGKLTQAYAESFTSDQLPLKELIRRMYPSMNDERRTALEPNLVYIKIRLNGSAVD